MSMATALPVQSLEELCFNHILKTLEEYSVETLALLPTAVRKQLLLTMPILDICQLEGTEFTMGIDMESVWEQLYKQCRIVHSNATPTSWRHELLSNLVSVLLNGFALRCMFHLVAINNDGRFQWENGAAKSTVPPRYEMYNSPTPSSSTVIKLIKNKCCFLPQKIRVSDFGFICFLNGKTRRFPLPSSLDLTLLEGSHAQETIDLLPEFLKDVKALTVKSYRHRRGEGISRLLKILLHDSEPKLISLKFLCARHSSLLNVLTQFLTSSYNSLKEFNFLAANHTSDVQKLISITEHQPLLQEISVSIACRYRLYQAQLQQRLSGPLHYWLQTCLKKPLLQQMSLRFDLVSFELLLEVLVTFLSTPSSHKQTLVFFNMNLIQDQSLRSYMFTESLNPEFRVHHKFDVTCTQNKTLKFSSCVFGTLFIEQLASLSPLKLKQLTIHHSDSGFRCFATSREPDHKETICRIFQKEGLEMERLELQNIKMDSVTLKEYDSLLQKSSLKNVSFVKCTDIDSAALREAAELHKFSINETLDDSEPLEQEELVPSQPKRPHLEPLQTFTLTYVGTELNQDP